MKTLLTLQKATPIVDKEGRPNPWLIQYELQGFTGTIATAKLTGGGANGLMVFFNGKLVSQTAAT